jgi:hypothetical protein
VFEAPGSEQDPSTGPHLSEFARPEQEVSQDDGRLGRRYPSTLGGLFYLIVLGSAVAGIALSAAGRWHAGMIWLGGSLLAAAVVRLVLPESQAGMLHVRRRLVDVALLLVLGGGVLAAAAAVPIPR